MGGEPITGRGQAAYRLELARGFLEEARQDKDLRRWRSAVDGAQLLGPDIHVQTDYGHEVEGRTPWELFDEADAGQALAVAEEAVSLIGQIVGEGSRER